MNFAARIEKLPPYLFAEISRKIAEKRSQGVDVISFGIGDPDLPTPEHILESLREASLDPANHRYPETEGLPELRQAIADWYERRFGVPLDPQREVLPLIGSKEGIGHIALCFIDPGDVALVPNPSYPVYAMGTLLAVHLGIVVALFLTMPYGKFVHAIYRYAALIRFSIEQSGEGS